MTRSPNRLLATVLGTGYILIGLLGFTVTGGVDFFATSNDNLLLGIFSVNVFHNVAHLLVGAALLIAGLSGVRAAKTVNLIIGVAFLLLGIVGLFITDSPANILALNGGDHVLHFGSAIILLAVSLGAEKGVRTATA